MAPTRCGLSSTAKGIGVGRCTVERLMRRAGLVGRTPGQGERAPRSPTTRRPGRRIWSTGDFTAPAPNRLWVADLTYVATWSRVRSMWRSSSTCSPGWIVGWQVADIAASRTWRSTRWRWRSGPASDGTASTGLVHHSDRGVQYLSIRYTERLAEAGVVASVGSSGDSYDNAMAESINGLYKCELIYHQGPWQTVDDVEFATLSWVHWWNTHGSSSPSATSHPSKRTRWLDTHTTSETDHGDTTRHPTDLTNQPPPNPGRFSLTVS